MTYYTPAPRNPKLPPVRINLLSDTQTRPTQGMREAIARADVGDEQIGDDPTVNLLCERVADLLGKEAAVFMPSGTMCNVAATLVHCRPGDEILAHETAHIIAREGGAHAALGGFQIMPLPGADGQFAPDTLRAALHPRSRYQPPQTVVSVEQTANIGGGTIWKKAALDEVVEIVKAHGLITHMDGARLLNACIATGISARDMAAGWDSAWIDFSKGLGAPIGGVIAGSRLDASRRQRCDDRGDGRHRARDRTRGVSHQGVSPTDPNSGNSSNARPPQRTAEQDIHRPSPHRLPVLESLVQDDIDCRHG